MSLLKLALTNFRRSMRNFGSLILSLSFSVFIFFNFQCMVYSEAMDVLMNFKKDYIDMILQAATMVFGVFLFFFIWYAANVFLNQRKKEIGIYIFMGLDNSRIGRMYALEAVFTGIFSLAAGLGFGILFSKFFQMLLLRLSDISVDVKFAFSLPPVIITALYFVVIYGFMVLKGYVSIVRSSVLNMLSGAKQKEMKQEPVILTLVKMILGTGILLAGYYCAVNIGRVDTMIYIPMAVVLVIIGTYMLYSGLIPWIVGRLTGNKSFLYRKERNLWVNNLAFRLKRNHRMYAMVTILMICAVTVLAVSIAMKQRYDRKEHFRKVYTIQVISEQEGDRDKIREGIERENKVEFDNQIPFLQLDAELFQSKFVNSIYGVVPYSAVKQAAKDSSQKFDYKPLSDKECVELSHVMLLSLIGFEDEANVKIGGYEFNQIAEDDTPYLGAMQSGLSVYVVNDKMYEELKPLGKLSYFYNYKLTKPENMEASVPFLDNFVKEQGGEEHAGYSMIPEEDNSEAWIRVLYSLCIFMFVTLILAGGSIIFIKLSDDACEDRERYEILQKMGIRRDILARSIKNEIRFTYYCPYALMVVTSYFAVYAMEKVMKEELFRVNIYSAVIVLAIFTAIYMISVQIFKRRVLE